MGFRICIVLYVFGIPVFLLLTTPSSAVQLWTPGVVSSVYTQDVGYRDTIII